MIADTLILGGGVIGLSIAYELARHGHRTIVLDRQQPGREASWAGAGILPPAKFRTRAEPYQWLAGYSSQLHPEWATRLRDETGIDNGYRQCGGIYLADSSDAASELLSTCEAWRREGLSAKWMHASDLDAAEPALTGLYQRFPLEGAAYVAEEAQLRNPRHLRALLAGCHKRGVTVTPGVELFDFEVTGVRITKVRTSSGDFQSENVVIAAGAWSGLITRKLNIELPVRPIRGQMVLLDCGQPILTRVINLGRRYLVPRDDGRLLIGSTEEDVGFDCRTSAEAVHDLLALAMQIGPSLNQAKIQTHWAGLRPHSPTQWPFLGPLPNFSNAFIAAGHFRQGLWLSTGTAVVMSRLLRGESPGVNLAPFSLEAAPNA